MASSYLDLVVTRGGRERIVMTRQARNPLISSSFVEKMTVVFERVPFWHTYNLILEGCTPSWSVEACSEEDQT